MDKTDASASDLKYKKLLNDLASLCSSQLGTTILKIKLPGSNGINASLTGNRIKTLCLDHGYTAKQIQQEIGVRLQSIYAWFTGKSLPSLDNIYQLGSLLGVSVDQMLVGTETEVCFCIHIEQTDQQRTGKLILKYISRELDISDIMHLQSAPLQ